MNTNSKTHSGDSFKCYKKNSDSEYVLEKFLNCYFAEDQKNNSNPFIQTIVGSSQIRLQAMMPYGFTGRAVFVLA